MKCLNCDMEYKANGSDIWMRKCPGCQGGRPSSSGQEQVNLRHQFIDYVEDIIAGNGTNIILTRQEIIKDICKRYGSNESSVIPSDYCYNRVNLDKRTIDNPLLFEMLDSGEYLLLGLDYPYNKPVYHRNKMGKMIQVGNCIDGKRILDSQFTLSVGISEIKKEKKSVQKQGGIIHRTSRNIGDGLRFKVFKRDNYRCCICGSSPAKDSSVELHVDHIIPWSKGGETILENLQVLCSRCNIGKSNSD